ncbi:MAG TPA: lipoprotein [Rhodocyclaceae bacterium]|nr:lipoprotein [Rhodocyclaceae bacterium]
MRPIALTSPILVIVLLACSVSACGIKGPLYLPPQSKQPSSAVSPPSSTERNKASSSSSPNVQP